MRKFFPHIFILLLALLACTREADYVPVGEDGAPDGRVTVTFSVLTEHNPDTKALGEETNLNTDRMYLAVFGGSGYFKEYIHATFVGQTREVHKFVVENSKGEESTTFSFPTRPVPSISWGTAPFLSVPVATERCFPTFWENMRRLSGKWLRFRR